MRIRNTDENMKCLATVYLVQAESVVGLLTKEFGDQVLGTCKIINKHLKLRLGKKISQNSNKILHGQLGN